MDNPPDITVLSLCTGYGGLELGLARALENPLRVVAVEVEAYELWATKLKQDYFQRQSLRYFMSARGYIYWPTLRASCGEKRISWKRVYSGNRCHNIEDFIAYYEKQQKDTQLNLNPVWCEWLMGLPQQWTDLGSWAMESYPSKPKKPSGS